MSTDGDWFKFKVSPRESIVVDIDQSIINNKTESSKLYFNFEISYSLSRKYYQHKEIAMPHPVTLDLLRSAMAEVSPAASFTEFNEGDDLFELRVLDSFSTVQLIGVLEQKLNFTFNYADLHFRNFHTLNSILNMLTTTYHCK